VVSTQSTTRYKGRVFFFFFFFGNDSFSFYRRKYILYRKSETREKKDSVRNKDR
jgi:hypothetical protein